MDKYHIYDEIGKGEFSQVFKGREKKKIEYVAIKRIEKSAMSKIVDEVQNMHKLNSAHVLRFYDWYETRNNLWLILEYCTGGDLEMLLKQDGYLPETSVRIFGLDILAGVKYLHSLGFIHCDIRPRNFLVDEYGILKLSDFKLMRPVPDRPVADTPLDQRGTPCYMAPELFTAQGVHSYQSDFWSVGCMLYELRRGFQPFGDSQLQIGELYEKIRTVEPVAAPIAPPRNRDGDRRSAAAPSIPSVSAELADLLLWMLEKSAAHRCDWAALSNHPFWLPNKPPPPIRLPPQDYFDRVVRDAEQARVLQVEQAAQAEFGVVPSSEVLSAVGAQTAGRAPHNATTPLKLPRSDSTPIRPAPGATKQQQHQQQQQGSPVDRRTQDKHQKALELEATVRKINSIESQWGDDAPSGNNHSEQVINLSFREQDSFVASKHQQHQQQEEERVEASPAAKNRGTSAATTSPRGRGGADTSHLDDHSSPYKLHGAAAVRAEDTSSGGRDDHSASDLISHSSDAVVKPIVGNSAIEPIDAPGFKERALTFEALSPDQLAAVAEADLEPHMNLVFKALHKATQLTQASVTPTTTTLAALNDRINILGYLCSLAGSAEVANVVLNTHFLSLVLKLMKSSPLLSAANLAATQTKSVVRAGSASATSNTATLATHVAAAFNTSRVLAATVLAMMLRYATFIQPPAIRAREEHIVLAIVAMLRESGKLDPRFRRRAVAALGETIFYITAQDEDLHAADGADKWLLPNAAIETIGRCLRDDSDEIVRHYAAKTVENVFAQGGLEFRRRFTSFDVAVRLLELSLQPSRSGELQATCGMALSHMFLFVTTPNNLPHAAAGSSAFNGEATSTVKEAHSVRKGATITSTTSANTASSAAPNPFQVPLPVSGAKFIARVLEKGQGGLSGMLETFKDGQPKLQQAFLNILNIVFAAPINIHGYRCDALDDHSTAPASARKGRGTPTSRAALHQPNEDASSVAQAVGVALRLTRSFFLRSASTLPHLVKLVEHGVNSPLRGKALLAAQLICRLSPSALASLAETRLPQQLARVLEPVVTQQHQALVAGTNPAGPAQQSYFVRTALSMVGHLRSVCEQASADMAEQLQILATQGSDSHGETHSGQHQLRTPEPSPDKAAAHRRKTPSSALPLRNTPSTTSVMTTADRAAFNAAKLRSSARLLQAAMSMASSPVLRLQVLAIDGRIVANLSQCIQLLTASQVVECHQQQQQQQQHDQDAEVEDAVGAAEQACLMALETVAQIDLNDVAYSASGPPVIQPARSPSKHDRRQSQFCCWPSRTGWRQFVEAVVLHLVPAASQLVVHPSGDVRVVTTSSMRRLLPAAIRACLSGGESGAGSNCDAAAASSCVASVVSRVPQLLRDRSPIPQYTLRLLSDLVSISRGVTGTAIRELEASGGVGVLLGLLKGGAAENNADDDDRGLAADPQLCVFLCALVDHREGVAALLEADLATALSAAVIEAVYVGTTTISRKGGGGDVSGDIRHELVQPQLDLLHATLHFVVQNLVASAAPSAAGHSPVKSAAHSARPSDRLAAAEQFRRLAGPLRALTPVLLMILAKADRYLRTVSALLHRQQQAQQDQLEECRSVCAVFGQLSECAAECLAILFDLFQEAVCNQILARQTVTVDTGAGSGSEILSPRVVLARLLDNSLVECRLKTRLLQLIMSVCKLAVSSGQPHKAKDLLSQEPLASALQRCVKTSSSPPQHTDSGFSIGGSSSAAAATADRLAFIKLVLQALDLGSKL